MNFFSSSYSGDFSVDPETSPIITSTPVFDKGHKCGVLIDRKFVLRTVFQNELIEWRLGDKDMVKLPANDVTSKRSGSLCAYSNSGKFIFYSGEDLEASKD